MRILLPLAFVVVVLGASGAAYYRDHQVAPTKPHLMAKNVEMRYRTLSNGTVVYEETPGQGSIEDIEPAAGADPAPDKQRFKYDPLTQTYRVQAVDREGNKGQDIFDTPQ